MKDRKEYFRNYYKKHKAKLNSQMHLVYKKDPEMQKARCFDFRLRNKLHTLEYAKKYRNAHKLKTNRKVAEIKKKEEYKIYRYLKRKYNINVPISLIREIRER
jgi:hypothetical protein